MAKRIKGPSFYLSPDEKGGGGGNPEYIEVDGKRVATADLIQRSKERDGAVAANTRNTQVMGKLANVLEKIERAPERAAPPAKEEPDTPPVNIVDDPEQYQSHTERELARLKAENEDLKKRAVTPEDLDKRDAVNNRKAEVKKSAADLLDNTVADLEAQHGFQLSDAELKEVEDIAFGSRSQLHGEWDEQAGIWVPNKRSYEDAFAAVAKEKINASQRRTARQETVDSTRRGNRSRRERSKGGGRQTSRDRLEELTDELSNMSPRQAEREFHNLPVEDREAILQIRKRHMREDAGEL